MRFDTAEVTSFDFMRLLSSPAHIRKYRTVPNTSGCHHSRLKTKETHDLPQLVSSITMPLLRGVITDSDGDAFCHVDRAAARDGSGSRHSGDHRFRRQL